MLKVNKMEKGNLKKGLLNMTMILIPIIIMISIFLFTSEPYYIHVCNQGDDVIEDDVCVTSNGAFYQVTNSNEKVFNSNCFDFIDWNNGIFS